MIRIRGLKKRLGKKQVLDGVDLDIATGETVVVMGRSGTGKSVLLKHIIGLMTPDSGSIEVEGQEIASEVNRRLVSVALPDTGNLYPRELSGGMSRRAALARTIVTDPEIVLCDEPFSGLDPINVRRIEALLVDLNRRLGLTMIIASHHLASSLRMADRIVFLVDGRAIAGTPEDLLRSQDPRVLEFLRADSADPDEHAAAAAAGRA